MKMTRLIMGMPVIIHVKDKEVKEEDLEKVFDYFRYVDEKFSTYKSGSEISLINKGLVHLENASRDMKLIFRLAESTKRETNGYFDIYHKGRIDPSGIVKGWAIYNAAKILEGMGYRKFYVEAGGDIQVKGKWKVGIRNPFKLSEYVKVLELSNMGIATSGTYERGSHIYNPRGKMDSDIVSLTVVGPNIYEADRFATPSFAMGRKGIEFIEGLRGFEGYMIDSNGIATFTSNFKKYEKN